MMFSMKHKDDVNVGDTIEHNGHERTVCACDIKQDSFMGRTLFGDSYRLGYQLVKVLEKRR